MSNSEIEQSGTVKGHLPNEANLSGRISNGLSLSGYISIGSGAGDFIIKMTIEVNGDNYTVTSCDKTMEQIDAAVASGQNIKAIAFDKYVMPMIQMEYSESYTFGAFLGPFLVMANVTKNPESGTDDWQFYLSPITADIVEYSNASMPRISTVGDALNELVPKSHSHENKAVLDKFSESDGKPTYNGEALGGGASDFIIKMTVESNGSELIVTSCDTTVEQIDEAVSAEKRVALIASIDSTILELPMIQGRQGYSYYFGAFLSESVLLSTVYKTENTSSWAFSMFQIWSSAISYSNDALPNVTDVESALNALVTKSHTHSNKAVLDKFAETDGKPTYDGETLGSDFIIKMTVTSDDNGNYTVTSCDTTVEQIDAAVAAEKRVVVIATDTDINLSWDIPIVQGFNGSNYYFATFLLGQAILSFVQKVGENQARWQFVVRQIGSEFISYSNDAIPNISTVGGALDALVPKSHTHANKDTLDKLSDSNGKLQYNGSDVGLKGADGITPTIGANGNWYLDTTDTGKPSRGEKGDKGDPGSDANVTKANVITALGYTPEAVSAQVNTGSNITLADNTEYRLADVTTLTLTYPTGNFECWMRLDFAESGDITVTLPTGTKYIGTAPDFKNGETWELSIKDGVVIAQKVGEGA